MRTNNKSHGDDTPAAQLDQSFDLVLSGAITQPVVGAMPPPSREKLEERPESSDQLPVEKQAHRIELGLDGKAHLGCHRRASLLAKSNGRTFLLLPPTQC
jgi:hypothetical protein